jgi:tRNA pseudouridine55 synthase
MARRGKRGEYRDVDGILILDKPLGQSSNQALQQLRKLYRARKAGHCGSLDPLATGVLPVCLGEATKFSSYLLGAAKTYRATCRLGQTTTTGDAEGAVIESTAVDVEHARVAEALALFRGEIEQIPPMYSALKHEGRRLYQLAREGKQVERKPRRVNILQLDLISLQEDNLVIEVSCSKGTYIRTLAEDIGNVLGCGAHLTALRRIAVDTMLIADAVTMDELVDLQAAGMERIDALLLPVTAALTQFPELRLDTSSGLAICHGKRVSLQSPGLVGLCRLVSAEGHFLGLGEVAADGDLMAKRLMNTAR